MDGQRETIKENIPGPLALYRNDLWGNENGKVWNSTGPVWEINENWCCFVGLEWGEEGKIITGNK